MVSDRSNAQGIPDDKEQEQKKNAGSESEKSSASIKDAHATGMGSLGWSDEKLENKERNQKEGTVEDY